jgi:hypothetical protein
MLDWTSAANGALLSAMESSAHAPGLPCRGRKREAWAQPCIREDPFGYRIVEARSLVPFREAAAAAEQPDA